MKNLRERMWDIMSYASGILIATFIIFLVVSVWQIMPRIDGWLVPIVRFAPATDITRDPQSTRLPTGRACYTMNMAKLGVGRPITYRFYVRTWLSPEIPVSAYIVKPNTNDARDVQRYDNHKLGAKWSRRYCFELPGTIADADDFTVSGAAFHHRHALWDTETPIPPFNVGGIK